MNCNVVNWYKKERKLLLFVFQLNIVLRHSKKKNNNSVSVSNFNCVTIYLLLIY